MARSRNIKPGFFLNDQLAEVDPLGRILFIGLWSIADREGRLEDRPRRIKAEVLPYDDCDIEFLLTELHQKDFIVRYEINGEKYIWIKNFLKHQNPHIKETPSIIPEYCPQIYTQFYPQASEEIYPQTYPQNCTQTYAQVCPQVDPDKTTMLPGDNPTATKDSAIPDTSTGNSDTFPADSLILIPDPPSLMPLSFNLESGAEPNLEPNTDFELSENTDATSISKTISTTINKKAAATAAAALTMKKIVEKEFGKGILIFNAQTSNIMNCSNILNKTLFTASLVPLNIVYENTS